jgi:hypothetical protein
MYSETYKYNQKPAWTSLFDLLPFGLIVFTISFFVVLNYITCLQNSNNTYFFENTEQSEKDEDNVRLVIFQNYNYLKKFFLVVMQMFYTIFVVSKKEGIFFFINFYKKSS